MTKASIFLVGAALLIAMGTGCDTDAQLGPVENWSSGCSSDDECGSALSCMAAYPEYPNSKACWRPCKDDSDCNSVDWSDSYYDNIYCYNPPGEPEAYWTCNSKTTEEILGNCTPKCDNQSCGGYDGCGGTCGCKTGYTCVSGTCEHCTPSCDNKTCGNDDGCGGVCDCNTGYKCEYGTCKAWCAPQCIPYNKPSVCCGYPYCAGDCAYNTCCH